MWCGVVWDCTRSLILVGRGLNLTNTTGGADSTPSRGSKSRSRLVVGLHLGLPKKWATWQAMDRCGFEGSHQPGLCAVGFTP